MAMLYSIEDVVEATDGRPVGVTADYVTAISIDSREIPAGALFVAIKGDRFDGHDFVEMALANGAAAALVSQGQGVGRIVVPDPLDGLIDLARFSRARSNAAIVAVTGSAGKTTTKEAIRTVLAAAGETHFSVKSFNNHWGVPLMLAGLPVTAQFGVFEIGMNHPGEITPLAEVVRPHIAVITTVAAAHLEFFDSVAGIARAKAEIFAGLEPGGTAVLNSDHEHFSLLTELAAEHGVGTVISYGFADTANWRIEVEESTAGGSRAIIRHGDESIPLQLQVPGRHMLANAVAALVVAERLGVARDVTLAALAQFEAPEGRGLTQRLGPHDNPLLLVDESYNANVASMNAAMSVFAGTAAPSGRKLLVLGDMLELGAEGPALHAGLLPAVEATGADAIYLVGTAISGLRDALGVAPVAGYATHVEELTPTILDALAYGDAVMVKGSKGVRLAGLVAAIREKFR